MYVRLVLVALGIVDLVMGYREIDFGSIRLSSGHRTDGIKSIAWGLVGIWSGGAFVAFAQFA